MCGDAADKQDNLLFTCKGHGCDVVVHQGTSGVRKDEIRAFLLKFDCPINGEAFVVILRL